MGAKMTVRRMTMEQIVDWMDQATVVIEAWERCFEALTEEQQLAGLGFHKSTVVLEYIQQTAQMRDNGTT